MDKTVKNITLPEKELINFCRRWKINEFSLFGSVLRDDFNPDSDLDVLVEFDSKAEWGLFDHVQMEEELSALFGRKIDLLSKKAVRENHNRMKTQEILSTAQVVYAA